MIATPQESLLVAHDELLPYVFRQPKFVILYAVPISSKRLLSVHAYISILGSIFSGLFWISCGFFYVLILQNLVLSLLGVAVCHYVVVISASAA